MHNSTELGQDKQDRRVNGMEDSPIITVEYLRARLLSERSVSKAARERADELAKRVEELEEQLKIVTVQRKRAEKATLDVLAFLGSHGISDMSEPFDSESDQEEYICESHVGKSGSTKEVESSAFSELKRNDKDSSGSDHESTPSSGRSLSWKGRKGSPQSSEKKYLDYFIRRRTPFAQFISSPRHRLGRSCRQRRSEKRSAVADESTKPDVQDNNDGTGSKDSENWSENQDERDSSNGLASTALESQQEACDASCSVNNHRIKGEMETALELQAQLIGRYEVQEKAQKEWEEKFAENNVGTPDSCEPGNHSDVTEDREDTKSAVSYPSETISTQTRDHSAENEPKEPSVLHFNSFKLSVHTDARSSQDPNSIGTHDFVFPVANDNQTHDQNPHQLSHFHDSDVTNSLEIISYDERHTLKGVLGALEEAKSLLKRQINKVPLTTSEYVQGSNEPSGSGIRDVDRLKDAVGCPGLFRVPTEAPSPNRVLGSCHSSTMINYHHDSRGSLTRAHQYLSAPTDSGPSIPRSSIPWTQSSIATGNPQYDFKSNTGLPSSSTHTYPSYSSSLDSMPLISYQSHSTSPDLMPRMPFHETFPSRQSPRTEVGIPPSGQFLFYDDHIRRNMHM